MVVMSGKRSSQRWPSMKVPPKRKGNGGRVGGGALIVSPSMKVPPKRKGNAGLALACMVSRGPSMKVPPKRKGNPL